MENTYEPPAIEREGTVHELTEAGAYLACDKSGEHGGLPFPWFGDRRL
ncbi:MAG TPA: hypothetical protein VK425_04785 [Acidimicrobiales bacterium]|nr:hypothetical protein [Acidimicrobiales bacterium]